jgi:hypothetical protein
MSDTPIHHFLVVYDIPAREANVDDSFGDDYDAALVAYTQAEETYRGREDIEVVLLGADSIETIKKTHSSYFSTRKEGFERFFSVSDLLAATHRLAS